MNFNFDEYEDSKEDILMDSKIFGDLPIYFNDNYENNENRNINNEKYLTEEESVNIDNIGLILDKIEYKKPKLNESFDFMNNNDEIRNYETNQDKENRNYSNVKEKKCNDKNTKTTNNDEKCDSSVFPNESLSKKAFNKYFLNKTPTKTKKDKSVSKVSKSIYMKPTYPHNFKSHKSIYNVDNNNEIKNKSLLENYPKSKVAELSDCIESSNILKNEIFKHNYEKQEQRYTKLSDKEKESKYINVKTGKIEPIFKQIDDRFRDLDIDNELKSLAFHKQKFAKTIDKETCELIKLNPDKSKEIIHKSGVLTLGELKKQQECEKKSHNDSFFYDNKSECDKDASNNKIIKSKYQCLTPIKTRSKVPLTPNRLTRAQVQNIEYNKMLNYAKSEIKPQISRANDSNQRIVNKDFVVEKYQKGKSALEFDQDTYIVKENKSRLCTPIRNKEEYKSKSNNKTPQKYFPNDNWNDIGISKNNFNYKGNKPDYRNQDISAFNDKFIKNDNGNIKDKSYGKTLYRNKNFKDREYNNNNYNNNDYHYDNHNKHKFNNNNKGNFNNNSKANNQNNHNFHKDISKSNCKINKWVMNKNDNGNNNNRFNNNFNKFSKYNKDYSQPKPFNNRFNNRNSNNNNYNNYNNKAYQSKNNNYKNQNDFQTPSNCNQRNNYKDNWNKQLSPQNNNIDLNSDNWGINSFKKASSKNQNDSWDDNNKDKTNNNESSTSINSWTISKNNNNNNNNNIDSVKFVKNNTNNKFFNKDTNRFIKDKSTNNYRNNNYKRNENINNRGIYSSNMFQRNKSNCRPRNNQEYSKNNTNDTDNNDYRSKYDDSDIDNSNNNCLKQNENFSIYKNTNQVQKDNTQLNIDLNNEEFRKKVIESIQNNEEFKKCLIEKLGIATTQEINQSNNIEEEKQDINFLGKKRTNHKENNIRPSSPLFIVGDKENSQVKANLCRSMKTDRNISSNLTNLSFSNCSNNSLNMSDNNTNDLQEPNNMSLKEKEEEKNNNFQEINSYNIIKSSKVLKDFDSTTLITLNTTEYKEAEHNETSKKPFTSNDINDTTKESSIKYQKNNIIDNNKLSPNRSLNKTKTNKLIRTPSKVLITELKEKSKDMSPIRIKKINDMILDHKKHSEVCYIMGNEDLLPEEKIKKFLKLWPESNIQLNQVYNDMKESRRFRIPFIKQDYDLNNGYTISTDKKELKLYYNDKNNEC